MSRHCLLLVWLGCTLNSARGLRQREAVAENQISRDQPLQETEENVVLLLGITGAGKSTLCQWLLADASVCPAMGGRESVTKETQIVEGSWFGDMSIGPLMVVDTPGFQDTDGQDAALWIDTIKTLTESVPKVDLVVLVAKFERATPAQIKDELNVMKQLRSSFGADIWKRVVIFSKSDEDGPDDEFNDNCAKVKQNAKDIEFAMAWNQQSKALLEKDIDGIRCFGAYLFRKDEKGKFVFSAADTGHERYERYALHQLVSMREAVQEIRREKGMWQLKDICPRFGPSTPEPGDFICLWPKICELNIQGMYLSDSDQLQLVKEDQECGDSVGISEQNAPVQHVRQRTERGNDQSRYFNLGVTDVPGTGGATKFKVCYCEYGACDLPERFSQSAGTLTIESVTCPILECDKDVVMDLRVEGSDQRTSCPLSEVEPPHLTYGKTVELFCKDHYIVGGDTQKRSYVRSCEENGELSKAAEICKFIDCKAPPEILQAQLAAQPKSTKYGNRAQYMCEDNFSINGAPDSQTDFVLECEDSATWTVSDEMALSLDDLVGEGCRRRTFGEWGQCSNSCGSGTQTRSWQCDPPTAKCKEPGQNELERPCRNLTGCIKCDPPPELLHAHLTNSPSQQLWQVRGDDAVYRCDGYSTADTELKKSLSFDDRKHFPQKYTIDGSAREGRVDPGKVKFKLQCVEVEGTGEGMWEALDMDDKALDSKLEVLENGCRRWELREWGGCSVACGAGSRHRDVECSTGNSAHCGGEAKAPAVIKTESCLGTDCPREKVKGEHSFSAGLAPGRLTRILSAFFVACFLNQYHFI